MDVHIAWLFSAVYEVSLHSMKDKRSSREEVADMPFMWSRNSPTFFDIRAILTLASTKFPSHRVLDNPFFILHNVLYSL